MNQEIIEGVATNMLARNGIQSRVSKSGGIEFHGIRTIILVRHRILVSAAGGFMIIGLMLITAGILIVIYPPLLSLIVASVLIVIGLIFVSISWRFKRMKKNMPNPYVDFFMRH